jgi:hypothetical protein
MIRRVLKNLRTKNQVECLGRGQNANGKKPPSGNWVMSNELGNELGNINMADQSPSC